MRAAMASHVLEVYEYGMMAQGAPLPLLACTVAQLYRSIRTDSHAQERQYEMMT